MTFSPCLDCKATDWEYLGPVPLVSAPDVLPLPPGVGIFKYGCRVCGQPMYWGYGPSDQTLQPA